MICWVIICLIRLNLLLLHIMIYTIHHWLSLLLKSLLIWILLGLPKSRILFLKLLIPSFDYSMIRVYVIGLLMLSLPLSLCFLLIYIVGLSLYRLKLRIRVIRGHLKSIMSMMIRQRFLDLSSLLKLTILWPYWGYLGILCVNRNLFI